MSETINDDRALISLSTSLYTYLYNNYAESEPDFDNEDDENSGIIRVGRIGDILDTPLEILNKINIILVPDDEISNLARDDDEVLKTTPNHLWGFWHSTDNTVVLNYDMLHNNYMKEVITHELRHALDDYKSQFKAGQSQKYFTPKNKQHLKTDNIFDPSHPSYLAQPAEINARFLQVLHRLVPIIRRQVRIDPVTAKSKIDHELITLMNTNHIIELFPEKEKSKDYKRLMSRAAQFIQREIEYNLSQLDN